MEFKLFKRRKRTTRILFARKAEKPPSVYVVYPTAVFDGWEVVKERDDEPEFFNTREEAISYAKSQAGMDGGAVVKLENWFGHAEQVWEVEPQAGQGNVVGVTDRDAIPVSAAVKFSS
jgi:hypothetical protein